MNTSTHSIKTIASLDELVKALQNGTKETYNSIIRSAQLTKEDFKEYASWSKSCYTRNCIADTDDFELILLCWEPRQITPIHDHGGEECWVTIIDGQFQETLYSHNEFEVFEQLKTISSGPGDITYMCDFMGFHNIKNLSDTRSMSLHFYAKPIRNCNIYCEDKKKLVNKDLIYDTFQIECV